MLAFSMDLQYRHLFHDYEPFRVFAIVFANFSCCSVDESKGRSSCWHYVWLLESGRCTQAVVNPCLIPAFHTELVLQITLTKQSQLGIPQCLASVCLCVFITLREHLWVCVCVREWDRQRRGRVRETGSMAPPLHQPSCSHSAKPLCMCSLIQ